MSHGVTGRNSMRSLVQRTSVFMLSPSCLYFCCWLLQLLPAAVLAAVMTDQIADCCDLVRLHLFIDIRSEAMRALLPCEFLTDLPRVRKHRCQSP